LLNNVSHLYMNINIFNNLDLLSVGIAIAAIGHKTTMDSFL